MSELTTKTRGESEFSEDQAERGLLVYWDSGYAGWLDFHPDGYAGRRGQASFLETGSLAAQARIDLHAGNRSTTVVSNQTLVGPSRLVPRQIFPTRPMARAFLSGGVRQGDRQNGVNIKQALSLSLLPIMRGLSVYMRFLGWLGLLAGSDAGMKSSDSSSIHW